MTGDVDPAPEAVDHIRRIDETKRGESRKVADARVRVFNSELDTLVVGYRHGETQRRDQLETAAEVVELTDLGQRCQGADRRAGRLDLQRLESVDLILTQVCCVGYIDLQRQHLGGDTLSEIPGVSEQFLISTGLAGGGGLKAVHRELSVVGIGC